MWNARFLLILLVAGIGCGGANANPASPSPLPLNVAGTWDGQFSGIVQGVGTPQTDSFVMELRQDGASVSGTLLYSGTTIPLPIVGTVEGIRFTYNGRVNLTSTCEATVRGEIAIDGARMHGPQIQSTCEGTAGGQMTATRR